jgi:hypothetical protein
MGKLNAWVALRLWCDSGMIPRVSHDIGDWPCQLEQTSRDDNHKEKRERSKNWNGANETETFIVAVILDFCQKLFMQSEF